jgi:hypothetical protein
MATALRFRWLFVNLPLRLRFNPKSGTVGLTVKKYGTEVGSSWSIYVKCKESKVVIHKRKSILQSTESVIKVWHSIVNQILCITYTEPTISQQQCKPSPVQSLTKPYAHPQPVYWSSAIPFTHPSTFSYGRMTNSSSPVAVTLYNLLLSDEYSGSWGRDSYNLRKLYNTTSLGAA